MLAGCVTASLIRVIAARTEKSSAGWRSVDGRSDTRVESLEAAWYDFMASSAIKARQCMQAIPQGLEHEMQLNSSCPLLLPGL